MCVMTCVYDMCECVVTRHAECRRCDAGTSTVEPENTSTSAVDGGICSQQHMKLLHCTGTDEEKAAVQDHPQQHHRVMMTVFNMHMLAALIQQFMALIQPFNYYVTTNLKVA